MKKKIEMLVVLTGLLVLSGVSFAREAPKTAKAELISTEGKKVGVAALSEDPDGVKISLKLFGLTPGTHALHIHQVGTCNPPDFKSAGGHFNPEGKKHGMKNPQGAHAGDLPNIVVGLDGMASVEVVARQVTLKPGTKSLFQPGGTALVIHAKEDDDMTDPSGNAGDRVACGPITE